MHGLKRFLFGKSKSGKPNWLFVEESARERRFKAVFVLLLAEAALAVQCSCISTSVS